jgi:hypothetical protein
MRLLVLADEPPWPTNSGGRIVVARELAALKSAGHSVDLIYYKHAGEHTIRPKSDECPENIHEITRLGLGRASMAHPLWPFQISSRPSERTSIPDWVTTYDYIISHHEWTIPLASRIKHRQTELGGKKPRLVLRSHNDEVLYYASLRDGGTSLLRRLYIALESRRITRQLIVDHASRADEIWLISEGDLDAYADVNVPIHTVSPILIQERSGLALTPATFDDPGNLLFVGALDPPHAAAGLEWFLCDVWPTVRNWIPTAQFIVAGRRASPRINGLMETTPGVVFLGAVDSVEKALRLGRVFVNPVFAGSGVNIKMGPPAELGIPMVTTSVGARGLLPSVGTRIAEDAGSFAQACIDLLRDREAWHLASLAAIQALGSYSARHFLEATGLDRP